MLVTAIPRSDIDGNVTQEFVDSVGTSTQTYEYSNEQGYITVWNKGYSPVVLNVGTFSKTIDALSSCSINISFYSFTLNTPSETSEVQITTKKREAIESYNSVPRQVATRCSHSVSLSDGTINNYTYKIKHRVPYACTDIQFVYGNFYSSINSPFDIDGPNDITVKASIEYNGSIYPLTFGGADSCTITPGAIEYSDPIDLNFPNNTFFHSRNYVTVATGGKWPIGVFTITADDEGVTAGDKTVSGTMYPNTNGALTPLAIIGKVKSDKPSLFLLGDSIMWGAGDSPKFLSYVVRGLDNRVPFTNYGLSSDTAVNFLGPRKYKFLASKHYTHAICNLPVNDISANATLDQLKDRLINIWGKLELRGMKVFQTTITPRTTSTDSWATTENQKIFNAAQNSIRIALNDWIRTCPASLSGFFEAADTAETARGSGIWKAGYTSDGLHPNTTGHTAIGSCIDVNKFA